MPPHTHTHGLFTKKEGAWTLMHSGAMQEEGQQGDRVNRHELIK